jgi:beta-glucosidase-like glycosyl hydrolase
LLQRPPGHAGEWRPSHLVGRRRRCAIAKAVNAGVDVSMTPFDYVGWTNGLLQDVQNRVVSMHRVDDSVRRILTLKFELGLLDHPYVDPSQADAAVKANKDVARASCGWSSQRAHRRPSTSRSRSRSSP